MSWLALDNPSAVSRGDWVRTCFVDMPGNDNLPYASGFLKNFEQDYCYDRYWYTGLTPPDPDKSDSNDPASRMLNCGYAFTCAGSAADKVFFNNPDNGALPIFRKNYVEMGLIAHFQKAALLAASERLSGMVRRTQSGKLTLPERQAVQQFYDHFVEFTQTYWFDEISPQQQGRELFQLWRKHLRVQELYDEVRQELKDLVDYTEMRASATLNQRVLGFAFLSILLACIAVLAGIFGMNNIEFDSAIKISLGKTLPDISPLHLLAVTGFVFLGSLILGLFMVLGRFKKYVGRK
jgi:hypothetical protein